MVKLLKFFVFFMLLAVFGVVGLFFFLDPNAYKAEIARFVEARTGRPLVIQDEIGLSVFPWVGVRLGGMALGNGPGFGPEPFATVTGAQLRVKWLPLLERRLEVDTVIVQGLRLNLAKNGQGVTNWADLRASSPQETAVAPGGAGAPATTADRGASDALSVAAVAVAGLQVTDARLSWRDATQNRAQVLEIPELTTGAIRAGEPVSVRLRLRLAEGDPFPFASELNLTGELRGEPTGGVVQVKPVRVAFTGSGKGIPSGKVSLEATWNLDVDWKKESLRVEALQVSGAGLSLGGQWEGAHIFSAPRVTGQVTLSPFSPRAWLQQWGVVLPESQDPKAFGHLEGVFPFVADAQGVTLSDLQAQWDGSRVGGRFSLQGGAPPVLRWDLTLDTLDLDRYRRPAVVEKGRPDGEGEASAAAVVVAEQPEERVSLGPVRTLDLQGRLRIGTLRAAQLTVQEVDLGVRGQGGVLRLSPVRARAYQGTLEMEGEVDAREKLPRYSVDGRLEGVQAGPLLQDLRGREPVTGLARFEAHLAAGGESVAEVKKQLHGTARFSLKDGVVKGVDVARLLSDAYLVVQGQPVEAQGGEKSTPFSSLEGTVKIANGVVDNRDLVVVSPLLRIRGEGTWNLPADQVAYRVNASVVEALQGKGGRTITELTGLTVPIQVSGPVAKLDWRLDLKTLLAQEVAKRGKEKIENKLQDKAEELLKKRGLEGVLPKDVGKRLLEALPFR